MFLFALKICLQRFYLGGRLVFGPDVRSLLLTLTLILTPVILFWVFIAPSIVEELGAFFGSIVLVLSAVWTVSVSLSLPYELTIYNFLR